MKWKKPILSLGVEVECGTKSNLYELSEILAEYYTKDLFFGHDMSVFVDGKDIKITNCEIKYHTSNKTVMKNFLKKLWDHIVQNKTCGNHIHLKISNKFIPIFTYYSFYNFFINKYTEKFNSYPKYISRLGNKFCKEIFDEDILISQLNKEGDIRYRYHAINLRSLFKNLTIEIRVMPFAENFDEHWKQINFIEEIIHEFFNNAKNYILSERIISYSRIYEIKKNYEILIEPIQFNREGLI